jgi:short-subunit dehydrogenase
MAINFGGALNSVLEALPYMSRQGQARIANICSIGGTVAVPHLLPYTSSKFALVGFSLGLREELAQEGISVTTVIPGLMRTGSFLNARFKGKSIEEFTWFSMGAKLPVLSMNAERAAHRIVEATARGEAWVTLGMPAKILRAVGANLPSFTASGLSLANRLMPQSPGAWARERDAEPGWMVRDREL